MESKFTVSCKDEVAKIELSGRLDATNAPAFQEELKKLSSTNLNRLVFFAQDLEYISSAGLRAIIFAKQKIGVHAQVYLIAAQEAVLNIVRMSGLDNFMFIQDAYNE
jgi:anti-anti-sigma factor